MDVPFLKIGSKISIISKSNVRYEGFFVEVDTVNLQIALSEVRFYGTESRPTEIYIAKQECTYPYVIFKSTDIKDICVMNDPDEVIVTPLSALPVTYGDSMCPCSIWTCCSQSSCSRSGRRSSQYMWRIPRVIDYPDRSGDPNELPKEANVENFVFKQDYDFEKNNKIFEDLVSGVTDLNLVIDNAKVEKEEKMFKEFGGGEEGKKGKEKKGIETPMLQLKVEKVNVDIIPSQSNSKGAKPKKNGKDEAKKKLAPTAYNKTKSFFDKLSCASTYRSRNNNLNWREWNRETFGISMIRHQRRKRRSTGSSKQGSEIDSNGSVKGFTKALTGDSTDSVIPSADNLTVQKVRFKAVIMTKNRSSKTSTEGCDKLNFEMNSKDCIDGISAFDETDEKCSEVL